MKFLDLTGLNKFWAKLKGYFAKLNLTYGTRGYITGEGSNPDLLLEKMKLGIIQLYQGTGVGVKLYEYDAGDEANAVLVWDSSTLTGDALQKFLNGQNLGTIYTSTAGKCVKAEYNGHTSGSYYYCRAFGIFMTPKQVDSSHKATAVCRINGVDYASYTVDTFGGLVTAVCPDANYTTVIVKFTPSAATTRMRFYGFRCLNTYDGADAVLLGRATSALSATKATQDSDGNAINATYFKANTGTTTLQSGTAVKVGTQNGTDVKLQLPTIPAAANNGALKIGLNGNAASNKFTANQSVDSTLTFSTGSTSGTFKVDSTEVPIAGWSGKQDDLKYQLVEYGATYSDVSTIISNGKTPVVRVGDSQNGYKMYTWDGLTRTTSEGYTEYYFVLPVADATLIKLSYVCLNQLDSTWSSGEYSWQGGTTSQDALFHAETLKVTDGVTRFLKISFSGRVGRCIAVISIAGGSGTTNAVFRLSWTFLTTSNGLTDVGREMISCSNLSKPPLVYRDSSSFYIGIYDSLNRSATVSVMMSSENASKVSYSTVTRSVATASGNTELPITWHPVTSETIDEIHAAIYDDTSGTTVATTFNELKSWYSTKPNIILVERHQPSGSVSTTQKVYMLTDTSYSQGNPTKFVFTRVRNDTDYIGDVETMTCTSSGWTYSISNTKNATYAVSAGSADSATTAASSTYATSAGTAAVANGYSTGGAIDQAIQGLESRKLTTSDVYSDASGTASFLAIAAVPVVIDISSSQGVDIEALIRGTVSSAYRYNATSTKPYSRLWVLVNTSSYSKTFSGFADGSSLTIGAYRTACVAQIGPNFYKPDA